MANCWPVPCPRRAVWLELLRRQDRLRVTSVRHYRRERLGLLSSRKPDTRQLNIRWQAHRLGPLQTPHPFGESVLRVLSSFGGHPVCHRRVKNYGTTSRFSCVKGLSPHLPLLRPSLRAFFQRLPRHLQFCWDGLQRWICVRSLHFHEKLGKYLERPCRAPLSTREG